MAYHKKSLLNKLQIGGILKVKVASSFDKAIGWHNYYLREYVLVEISRKCIIGEIVISENPLAKERVKISRNDIDCSQFIILN